MNTGICAHKSMGHTMTVQSSAGLAAAKTEGSSDENRTFVGHRLMQRKTKEEHVMYSIVCFAGIRGSAVVGMGSACT